MKQKRDITLIAFGVVLLFLISACEGGGDVIGGAPTTPFLEGSQGLVIAFLEGSPPEEVTDGDTFPFQVIVTLKNEGEHKFGALSDIKIDLIGFAPSDFRSDPTDFTDADLQDISPTEIPTPRERDSEGNIIEGIETFIEFPKTGVNFNFKDSLAGNTVFIFRADVCYKYNTTAVSEICVLENLVDVSDDSICDPSETKRVFSSGSPVGVTAFRQNVAGTDKIQFSFDIMHSGSGDVFDPATAANCPKDPSTRRANEDDVRVEVDTGLTTTLNCGGLIAVGTKQIGTVKLVNGKRTITCTQDLADPRTDFIKSVDITVDFNYLDNVDKEILVKHLIS
ncbi:MAG: hypothetical protein IIC69_01170 [Nanoarchaeota archaeon]|nr:hypothetical protein [Nanoarchaeota archaeon]